MNISAPEIDFGTSGLRGPAHGFTPARIDAYISAFLEVAVSAEGEKLVFVGADFRESSPVIVSHCINVIQAKGWRVIFAGNVPTPALAGYANERLCPAIMVTGSHIPETYNGIKFYRREGELLKQDELPIKKLAGEYLTKESALPSNQPVHTDGRIALAYVKRFTSIFPKTSLKGLRIGVDMHSAVGRDLLVEILHSLGANCFPFRRSQSFIAVDTEALTQEDISRAKAQIKAHKLDCVVSTDGDGDRPLLIDETGAQINGDVLGALTAKSLGIEIVVTPLSSTSAIEKSGWFAKTIRTKIGSPYVVDAMTKAVKTSKSVAGFEANGGFLLESNLALPLGTLSRLPTRDALLPLVSVLSAANAQSIKLSTLGASLPARFMVAGRIKNVDNALAKELLIQLQHQKNTRVVIDNRLANPLEINILDGIRMTFGTSEIVHFRQSGNAPEMRVYVETEGREKSNLFLQDVLAGLEQLLNIQDSSI